MRALWTKKTVNFEGRWHSIPDAGINPLPIQQPIPIWLGGGADAVIKRIARVGDGWMPMWQPDEAGLKEEVPVCILRVLNFPGKSSPNPLIRRKIALKL